MREDSLDFPSALEGFGLSEYEARAYIAMLKHGSLLISELAYQAQIPRTKAYSTIKSLARKKLAEIIPGKPVKCKSLPPEETLEKAVLQQEKKVKSMKKTVINLRKLGEEVRKPIDVIESRYFTMEPKVLSKRIPEMIASSKVSVRCIVDSWGYRLLEASRDALLNALAADVDVKVVRLPIDTDTDLDLILPGITEVRIGKHDIKYNVFLFDDSNAMIVDKVTGKGLFIPAMDLNTILKDTLFNHVWETSIPIRNLLSIFPLKGNEDILNLLNAEKVNNAFVRAVSSAIYDEKMLEVIGLKLIEEIEESCNVRLFKEPSEATIPILTAFLTQNLGEGGAVKYDPNTNLLNVESPRSGSGIPDSVWMFAIAGLLKRNETPLSFVQNISYPEEGTHILRVKIPTITSTPNR